MSYVSKYWSEAMKRNDRNPELWVTRQAAHDYALRAEMNGEITKTGMIIPKESV